MENNNVVQLTPRAKDVPPAPTVRPVEILRELKSYQAERTCVKCDTGMMIPIPFNEAMATWTNAATAFPHICNGCGNKESYPERYPTIRYAFADGQP